MEEESQIDGEEVGNQQRGGRGTPTTSSSATPVAIVTTKEERSSQPVVTNLAPLPAPPASAVLPDPQPVPSVSELPLYLQPLPSEATAQQTSQWLQSNRFGSYLRVFSSFSGADILRLSRDDLIQICGLPDGIRLFNALHSKAIAPRLTLYLCVEQSSVYHALYLDSLSCAEMASKLAQLMGITADQIHDIYVQGPGGIHVLITDDVVRNIKDEAMFTIEILQDQSGERYRLLLKPASR
ncbi:transcription factor CP2-like isoform X2 [Zootermopsis nevadensis]|uniref:transcription factor CP2-like isoform X2 n=1 Tax=Zootermopsis nevadensis TaxID=136037 RepID=UPI000B8E7786|nr:transcription factor CP2-like isoform X2 [Zootermopsis nevadensis]